MSNSTSIPIDKTTSLRITAYPKGIDAFNLLSINVNAYIYELRTKESTPQTLPLSRENAKIVCNAHRSSPSSNQIIGGA